ncbi:GGDEF domain-containing protein [Qipengyuania qiaonensis]|uniref:diguanylate cyclase n=1 Tax=Qipengyuania qiaonensis TaxID=2867240 RepID=A0ABS7J4R8_9SPHN|nr:GGDEF domain-containing protein [Qipengyuania qiaonensis]MBX7481084.1 GGDEF domain-containing protein [Qipengyuania qiaonensis]
MRRILAGLLGPDIPAHLRDDFITLAACHMRGQALLVFAGFILSLPLVVLGASPETAPSIAFGLPVIILILAVTGLIVLRKPLDLAAGVTEARRVIASVWRLCLLIAIIGSIWCLGSWASAPAESKLYYPAIMALGALTLAYCLTAVRSVALTTLLITMVPIAIALASTGEVMNLVLAGSQIIAVGFQVFLINRHQNLLFAMTQQQHESAQQARRDPLTDLANRRALMEHFKAHAALGSHIRLMVVDIDRFKAINDRHGHDVGDEVLCAFAELLRIHVRGGICAARLGGEEFALLATAEALDPAIALQLLGEIRGAYMPHGEQITASIGVADGIVTDPADWNGLYGKADRALYRAKNDGRNRVRSHKAEGEADRVGDREPARSRHG